MSLEVYYQTGGTAFANIGTAVRWGTVNLTEAAELGEAAMTSITVDDAAGTADYVGLRKLYVSETSEGTADRVIWYGYVADQRITRGDGDQTMLYAAGRTWDLTLADANAALGYRILQGTAASRSAESGSARLAWILGVGSAYMTNDGLVSFPGTAVQMDAVDYSGQYLRDVLEDVALASGYNYWVRYNGATGNVQLFFGDATQSTAFASSVKISNVAADIDGTAVLAPDMGARLMRDPSRIASGVFLPYAKGAVYAQSTATLAEFGYRDQVAPASNVKTLAAATAMANRLLTTMDEQEERVTCSVFVQPSRVNDLVAGHRVQAKFTHFPGWDAYRWCRVVRRTVRNLDDSLGMYEVALELVPQTGPPVAAFATPFLDTFTRSTTSPVLGTANTGQVWTVTADNVGGDNWNTIEADGDELVADAGIESGNDGNVGKALTYDSGNWATNAPVVQFPLTVTFDYSLENVAGMGTAWTSDGYSWLKVYVSESQSSSSQVEVQFKMAAVDFSGAYKEVWLNGTLESQTALGASPPTSGSVTMVFGTASVNVNGSDYAYGYTLTQGSAYTYRLAFELENVRYRTAIGEIKGTYPL